MKKLLAVTLYFLLFLAIDVTPEGRGQHTPVDPDQHADAPQGPTSFDIAFPHEYGLSLVTVASVDSLVIGRGARIEAADGKPGNATNAGASPLIVEEYASAGAIVSTSSIRVERNVLAAVAKSSGEVRVGSGVNINSIVEDATLTPLVHRTINVPSLRGGARNAVVRAGQSIVLDPGRYREIDIRPGGRVAVSAGAYVIDRLNLARGAEFHLDTGAGSVNMYVLGEVEWQGKVTGDATLFMLSVLSQRGITLQRGFRGTILVPFGTLTLSARREWLYEGTFYGKNTVVGKDVTLRKIATPALIDGITASNVLPCVGDPVEVVVTPAAAAAKATVWIQGVVGGRQILQFRDAAGPRAVFATALTPDGRADFSSVPITLQHCAAKPGATAPLALHFWHGLRKPNVIELMVHDFDDNGHETSVSGPASYSWTFGDGQTATTASPLVSHDYSASIDFLADYSYFDVSVTATTAHGKAAARKIVPIWSLYAKNRAKGIVQPPAALAASAGQLTLTVQNYETTPLAITQAHVELIPCDPGLDARPQPPMKLAVTIPGRASMAIPIPMPPAIAADICSVGAHLVGGAGARVVYADGYETLKENSVLAQAITDPGTLKALDAASKLTRDPAQFDEFELRDLRAQGLIPPAAVVEPPAKVQLIQTLALHSGPPKIGDPCQPGDTSPLGLICGPTSGWVALGPEFLNAFKGNFIMDHGCGKIGQLLAAVHQLFSHTSIMVRNRNEVRHSTASSDRMNSNVDFVKERLDPDTLQFGYPGTAGADQTYTIEQMVGEYFVTDPIDAGKTWRMGGELSPNPSSCANDTAAVQPVVIRPAPDAPAAILQAVASVASHTGINSHYRFFNYSRADELLPGVSWARETESTVCSSFDRLAAVRAGLTLHPTAGEAGVPDGMRRYTVDQRVAAANALYKQVSNDVGEACKPTTTGVIIGGAGYLLGGPVGGIIGAVVGAEYCNRMIDNIASQVNNCFASDGCANTGDDWRNPGPGVAVSPDDMLDWDTWHQGGTYGYNEPLRYKPKGYRRAFAWAAASGSGSMTVKVVHPDMTPYVNATILLNTNPVGSTDAGGSFNIPTLAQGKYEVGAQFDPCATPGHPTGCGLPLEQANIVKVLPLGGSVVVTLTLCAGPVVGGVVTSCHQPGAGPKFTHVGIGFGAQKYLLCIRGSGMEVGGPDVPVTLTSTGGFSKGPLPGTGIDAGGGFFTSTIIERIFNTGFSCSGTVTITAFDALADVAIQTTVPARYWCTSGHTLPDFNNGCKP
jgi:hypothetical protein